MSDRAFFGFLTFAQLSEELKVLWKFEKGTYFFIYNEYGQFELIVKGHVTSGECIHHIPKDTWVDLPLIKYKATKPMDRGDAIINREIRKKRAKEAIDCWLIIGRRRKVVKDIRIMIGKMLWDNRREWIY
jgi:hypothetical protein